MPFFFCIYISLRGRYLKIWKLFSPNGRKAFTTGLNCGCLFFSPYIFLYFSFWKRSRKRSPLTRPDIRRAWTTYNYFAYGYTLDVSIRVTSSGFPSVKHEESSKHFLNNFPCLNFSPYKQPHMPPRDPTRMDEVAWEGWSPHEKILDT